MEEYFLNNDPTLGQYLDEFDNEEDLRQENASKKNQSKSKEDKSDEMFEEYDNEDLLER